MKDRNDEFLVDVFTGSPWEAELVKGQLESNGVQSSLKDGMMTVIAPYMDVNNEIVVQVNENDYEAAMEVIRNRESKNDD